MLIVRKDQLINLYEIKYSEAGYIIDSTFDTDMRRKFQTFISKANTKYAIHPTLVTTYPVVQNEYAMELLSIITADDLFL